MNDPAVLQVVLDQIVQINDFGFLCLECVFKTGRVCQVLHNHADTVDAAFGCLEILLSALRRFLKFQILQ